MKPVIAEIQQQPWPAEYREHLREKLIQYVKLWQRTGKEGGNQKYGLEGDRRSWPVLESDFYQMILPEFVNGGEFTRLGIRVHGPPQESLVQG